MKLATVFFTLSATFSLTHGSTLRTGTERHLQDLPANLVEAVVANGLNTLATLATDAGLIDALSAADPPKVSLCLTRMNIDAHIFVMRPVSSTTLMDSLND